MDSATYRHIVGQFPKSNYMPHSNFPCHNFLNAQVLEKISKNFNDIDEDGAEDDKFLGTIPCYKPFEYDVTETVAFNCGSGQRDVSQNLVRDKINWERNLKTIKIKDLKKAAALVRDLRKGKKKMITEELKRYINHFYKDPAPNFEGNYNWLYSGGNLVKVECSNGVTLIHSDYFNGFSGFNILKLNDSLDSVDFKCQKQTRFNSPILQISAKSKGEKVMIFVRQKKNTSLFSYDCNGLQIPQRLWRKKTKNSKLITCVDVNSNLREALVTDSSRFVHVYDTEARAKTFEFSYKNFKLKNDFDVWNQAVFGNHGIYVASRNNFFILDPRDKDSKPKLEYFPCESVNECEELCSVQCSACDSNYVYLGTSHHLVQMDLRCGKTVQNWTHLMQNYPQFIECVKDEDKDCIFLQSREITETLGTTNDYEENEDEKIFVSKSLFGLVKGIKSSVNLARLSGVCLNPHLVRRFNYDVTGIQSMKSNNGMINLFIANSGGDVFLSKLINKEVTQLKIQGNSSRRENILNSMKKYETHFRKFPPKKKNLNLKTINARPILQDLKSMKMKSKFENAGKLIDPFDEFFKPLNLIFCRDVLAPKILDVWKTQTGVDPAAVSSQSKVQQWMEKT